MDTIIEKLGVPDELILEDKIQKDLDNRHLAKLK